MCVSVQYVTGKHIICPITTRPSYAKYYGSGHNRLTPLACLQYLTRVAEVQDQLQLSCIYTCAIWNAATS